MKDLTSIPKCFDMPVESVDGRNVDEVFAAASRLVDHARKRKGPVFLHAVTERWAGSQAAVAGAADRRHRHRHGVGRRPIGGEHADWYRNHDPILIYARKLLAEGDVRHAKRSPRSTRR